MPIHARLRARRRRALPGALRFDDEARTGDEILDFWRWLLVSKYRLMGRFLGDLKATPDASRAAELDVRYRRALQQGERAYQLRSIVSILLALGVLMAAGSALAQMANLDASAGPVERVAAVATSTSVALLALRLVLDRYLERIDVAAIFLATLMARDRETM